MKMLARILLALPLLGWARKALPGVEQELSHRLMISFADPASHRSKHEFLDLKVRELEAMPGVVEVKRLKQIGMALVVLDSLTTEEKLVQELEEDPMVELVSPDTLVHFHGTAPGPGNPPRRCSATSHSGRHRSSAELKSLQDFRQCSAQSNCSSRGLAGRCCPTDDGVMLSCCNLEKTVNVVSFRSVHGEYMAAADDGSVKVDRGELDERGKFRLLHAEGGTVSLRTHRGLYVSVGDGGSIEAHARTIGRQEKFELLWNKDETVSFKAGRGRYFSAGSDGTLAAKSKKIDRLRLKTISIGAENQHIPDDPCFPSLWGLSEVLDGDIDAPEAWRMFTGERSPGVIVAIIDTGIDYTHEDLQESMWTNPGEIPGNGIDDDGDGYVDDVHGYDFANDDGDPMDDQMHGTHCAGTIAAVGNNSRGVVGVAWQGVRLMALKFLTATGVGRTSDAVAALDYAMAHGAQIVSNSWGGRSSNAAMRVAIDHAEDAGVLFIAAAGNSGTSNDKNPAFPANYPASNIIAVASTDRSGALSEFSCFGEQLVEIAAPGRRILSTAPGHRYSFLSGTSMAAPYVSGLAALIWMYRPTLSMLQVKELILSGARQIPELKHKVSTGLVNAAKALQAATTMEPPFPPQHAPQAVAFEDVDPAVGLVAGTVTITAAADESDVDYYKVYWVSRAGSPVGALGSVNSTGMRKLEMRLGDAVPLPHHAAGLVAVAANATGEQPGLVGSGAPHVTVEDFGIPAEGPRSAFWAGDTDLRGGIVTGNLSISRALDERTISEYNVYWSNASWSRGPKLGSIPSVGFKWPRCKGPSCPLINVTSIKGGLRYNRDVYGDSERARIMVSGPGTVRFTRFDTEEYFDYVQVLSKRMHGRKKVPFELELPHRRVAITWTCDQSASGSGWTFDLLQPQATAQLRVEGAVPHGWGLQTVPSYRGTEFRQGAVLTEVVDYDHAMLPSPGLARAGVNSVDQDAVPGAVAGDATVLPALGAAASGTVANLQLDSADTQGHMVDSAEAAGAPVPGSTPGRSSVPDTEDVDIGPGTEDILEPWLQKPPHAEKAEQVIWDQASWQSQNCVLGAVTIQGLAATDVTPSLHAAFVQAIAESLPSTGNPTVRITRVLAVPTVQGSGLVDAEPGVSATTVEFEVESLHALDRVESRLIILSKGGGLTERFSRALLHELAAAGARLPAGSCSSSVREPQRRYPGRSRPGRALAAPTQASVATQWTSEKAPATEGKATAAHSGATVVAALLALSLACAAPVPICLRWGGRRAAGAGRVFVVDEEAAAAAELGAARAVAAEGRGHLPSVTSIKEVQAGEKGAPRAHKSCLMM